MRTKLLLVLAIAACGNDDSGGPATVHNIGSQIESAYCNMLVRCGLVDDAALCRSLNLDLNVDPSLVAAVDAGKVTFDATKAQACLAGIASWSCDRTVVFANRWTPPECSEIFGGTVADGGACGLSRECVSNVCTVPACPMGCCQGTCATGTPSPPPGRVGDACPNGQCYASYCDPTSMKCVALLPAGATCTTTSQCDMGLTCAGTCVSDGAALGGPCTPNSTTACANIGDTCSTTTSTCVAVGLSGDPCQIATDCSTIYTCNAGHCALKPRVGETCSVQTSNGACVDQSYCDPTTLKCTAPQSDGAPCTSGQMCASNNCDQLMSVCTTPPVCI
jgi:hypothetical protein